MLQLFQTAFHKIISLIYRALYHLNQPEAEITCENTSSSQVLASEQLGWNRFQPR